MYRSTRAMRNEVKVPSGPNFKTYVRTLRPLRFES